MGTHAGVTGPLNLGNPDEFTIADLARQIVSLTGSSAGIEYHPLPADDPIRRRPDITAAREVLNWEPTVPLSEGLGTTVEHFRALFESA
jgi:UDP-glucuronate decarboxylase